MATMFLLKSWLWGLYIFFISLSFIRSQQFGISQTSAISAEHYVYSSGGHSDQIWLSVKRQPPHMKPLFSAASWSCLRDLNHWLGLWTHQEMVSHIFFSISLKNSDITSWLHFSGQVYSEQMDDTCQSSFRTATGETAMPASNTLCLLPSYMLSSDIITGASSTEQSGHWRASHHSYKILKRTEFNNIIIKKKKTKQ